MQPKRFQVSQLIKRGPSLKLGATAFSDRTPESMEASGCNIPASDRASFSSVSFLVFSLLEALVGMALNGFIVAVSCISGLKNKQLKSIDKILTALGITRFFYLCTCLVKIFWLSVSSRGFEVTIVYQMFKAAIWFLTCICFCFSACLCSFYCIKIANFGHRLFVHLKLRISSLVPWMLLVSMLGSLVNTYPFFSGIYNISCKNSTGSSGASANQTLEDLMSANQTLEDFTWETDLLSLFVYCGVGFSVAFSIAFASSFLLLFSLWRHTHTILNGLTGSSNLSMDAHFRAVKTILSLLAADGVTFVGVMILLSNVFSERSATFRLVTIIVNMSPSVQSQILIWSNPKLKRAFVRLTDWIKHRSWVRRQHNKKPVLCFVRTCQVS